jgi:hypothetical protein
MTGGDMLHSALRLTGSVVVGLATAILLYKCGLLQRLRFGILLLIVFTPAVVFGVIRWIKWISSRNGGH